MLMAMFADAVRPRPQTNVSRIAAAAGAALIELKWV